MSSAAQIWIIEIVVILVVLALACAVYFHYQSGQLQKQVKRLRSHIKQLIHTTKTDNAAWKKRIDELDKSHKSLQKYENLYRENKERLTHTKQELASLEDKVGQNLTRVNQLGDQDSARIKELQDKLQTSQRNLKSAEDDYIAKSQALEAAQEEIKQLKAQLRAYKLNQHDPQQSLNQSNHA